MDWKEVYKLPLHCIEGCPMWVNSSNEVHALDIMACDKLCIDLVNLINVKKVEFNKKHNFSAIDW